MTALELPPVSASGAATSPESTVVSLTQTRLASPNIVSLPPSAQAEADVLLERMTVTLDKEDVQGFNTAKQQLVQLLKRHKMSVTQWSPLILTLPAPYFLFNRQLPQINLSRTQLESPLGVVSLEKSNLQGASLQESNLERLSFRGSDLTGANLRMADLREADLTESILIDADLSAAKVSFALFDQANLYSANLQGVLAKQASFRRVNFRKADLRQSDFYQSDLSAARLQHADLREANLFMANLTQARFGHADLRKANLGSCNMQRARMQEALLCGATLVSSDMSFADLRSCRFDGVSLDRVRFEGTKLGGVDMTALDLSTCVGLSLAQLTNVRYNAATQFPVGFNPENHALIEQKCQGLHKLFFTVFAFLPHRCTPVAPKSA